MFSGQKVLVTGGSGFLGKAITKYLAHKGVEVLSIGSKMVDLRHRQASIDFFHSVRP